MKRIFGKKMKIKKNVKTGKKMKLCIGCLLLLAVLSGCTTDNDSGVPQAGSVSVPLQIGRAVLATEPSTRAVIEKEVPAGSVMGVFRRADADYNQVSNEPYLLDGTEWEPVNPDMAIGLRNAVSQLGAFYPFGVLPARGINVTLTARLWAADKEAYYAPFTASSLSATASFTLKHVYSRVSVRFKRDNVNFPNGTGKVTTFEMQGTGIYTNALLDVTKALNESPFSGYDTPGVSVAGFTRTATLKGTVDATDQSDCVDLLMVPNALSGDMTLKATVDDKEMSLKLAATKFGSKLEAGKRYNVVVTIRGTALWVNSIQFAGWEETPIGRDIDSEFQ